MTPLEASFERLRPHHQELVSTFYERFLEEHPGYRSMFAGDLRTMTRKIAVAMHAAVLLPDSPHGFRMLMHQMAARHRSADVPEIAVTPFITTLVEVIGIHDADHWTDELADEWSAALHRLWERSLETLRQHAVAPAEHVARQLPTDEIRPPDASEIALVRASLPRLRANTELFTRFYALLVARHPETRAMFHRGLARMSRLLDVALNSVVAALGSPGSLDGMTARLAARHAEAGITTEQYDAFVSTLLECISGALNPDRGDAADTMDAWRVTLEYVSHRIQTHDVGAGSTPGSGR